MANRKRRGSRYPSYLWSSYDLYPVPEYQFYENRKWRFDYCFPSIMIAIEIEGAIWTQGRHSRGAGMLRDMEKYNFATALGWRIFRFTPEQLKTGYAPTFIQKVIKGTL